MNGSGAKVFDILGFQRIAGRCECDHRIAAPDKQCDRASGAGKPDVAAQSVLGNGISDQGRNNCFSDHYRMSESNFHLAAPKACHANRRAGGKKAAGVKCRAASSSPTKQARSKFGRSETNLPAPEGAPNCSGARYP